jgi:hypothetical protein
MAQNPFDQLSKQYLEECLDPSGTVERQFEIPGEAKFVDVWFQPDPTLPPATDLGLLGRIAQTSCLLEPYRNVPTRTEVRVSMLKLFWIQEDQRRKAQLEELPEKELPRLWILAATTSKPLLEEAGGQTKSDWMPGIYFLDGIFATAIVAIDQLPETEDTLWLRILGRDTTQERAIREVLALPSNHSRRNGILRLLASWKVRIDLRELETFSRQEAIMALSEAFLQWEQQTKENSKQDGKQEERQAIALRMMQQGLAVEAISQFTGMSIQELQQLQ